MLLLCLAASAAAGCNDGVFIDEFMPDATSAALERSGGAATLRFKAANWEILFSSGPETPLYGDIYDAAGDLVARNRQLYGDGLLKMVYDDGLLYFRIERNDYRELSVILGENLRGQPFEVSIQVGNQYETGMVTATLAPTEKYRVDSIVYHWDDFYFSNIGAKIKESFTVNNTASAKPATFTVTPYRGECRTVRFRPGEFGDHRADILGTPLPEITIPDVENGRPAAGSAAVPFAEEEQRLPLPFSDKEQTEVTVPAGEQKRIEVLLVYEEFWVPYTLHASNPVTNRTRTFTGRLYSSVPYEYHILKLNPDQ